MRESSSTNLKIINILPIRFRIDLDLSSVFELIDSDQFDPYEVQHEIYENPSCWSTIPSEAWAATAVEMDCDINEKIAAGEKKEAEELIRSLYLTTLASHASSGLQIIKDLNEFWRFQPTVEMIFDLDDQQMQLASEYVDAFEGTDYDHALHRNKKNLLEEYKKWDAVDLGTMNINRGRDIFEECVKIYERGFPNLLALKHILDGKNPGVEELQRKRASAVRRELMDVDEHPNSVYFDQIVEKFDSTLRNGITHNDFIVDRTECEVRIPNRNTSYEYNEFNKIVRANIANGVFLTETFQALIEWNATTAGVNHRDPTDRVERYYSWSQPP